MAKEKSVEELTSLLIGAERKEGELKEELEGTRKIIDGAILELDNKRRELLTLANELTDIAYEIRSELNSVASLPYELIGEKDGIKKTIDRFATIEEAETAIGVYGIQPEWEGVKLSIVCLED